MALENGADVNSRFELVDRSLANVLPLEYHSRTALQDAIERNQTKVVELLLSRGANPDATSADGRTALFVAVSISNIDIVQTLIECGANVGWQDKVGKTALHVAAGTRHDSAAMLLLEHGANIHHGDRHKRTPLFYAARSGHRPLVELLLAKGARINEVDEDGHTAAWHACQCNAFSTGAFLLTKGAQVGCTGTKGRRLLDICIRGNTLEALPMLLQQGADVSFEDKEGRTALDFAAAYNRPRAIQLLLQHGADINHVSRAEGWTPCFTTVRFDFKTVLDELLASPKLNLDHRDTHGRTVLNFAAQMYNRYAVIRLLNKGADTELADPNGHTALSTACAHGNWEIARALVAHGANPQHQDNAGLTPAAVAASKGVRLLRILPVLGDHSDDPADQAFRDAVPGLIAMLRDFSMIGQGADALGWQDWLAFQGVGSRTIDALAVAASGHAALLGAMTGQTHEAVRPALQSLACAGILAELEVASDRKNEGAWAGALALAAAGRQAEAGLRAAVAMLHQTCAACVDEDAEISPVALYYRLASEHGMAGLLAEAVSSAFPASWPSRGATDNLAQAFASKLSGAINSPYFAGQLARASAASGNPATFDKLMERQLAMIRDYCTQQLAA
ncbi:MAG: ankyrin repeat domain-containing protein [Noviherbaspirillum sp.]